MARTAFMLTALLLSIAQPSHAQEDPWQKYMRELKEKDQREDAARQASQAQSDREYRELQQRLRTIQPMQEAPTIKTLQPQVKPQAQPAEDSKSGAVLVNTMNGMKQCRFVAGIAFCN